ncbi:MAG: cupin domain-containing protein [Chloroflexi bacterium]|nr:cupin domain-containing protein [Chloroflexota bacterium]
MAKKRVTTAAAGRRPSAHRVSVTGSTTEVSVGQRLNELRSERQMTIRELAEKSGLAVNTLSLIENGKTSPSVSTLQLIAAALEAPIIAFFEAAQPPTSIGFVKANQRPRAKFEHGVLEDLGAGVAPYAVEPFVVTLEPNSRSGAEPIVHTGYELVYCLSGHMLYTIENRPYLLEPGDSLLFESHLPHRWQNVHAEPAQTLLILYPLDTPEHPVQYHFDRHFSASSWS